MVVEQQIEGAVDRMLARGWRTLVVGALEELTLETMSVASLHRRSTARREAGDPLTSIRAFAGKPSGDGATVASDPVRMEVQCETSGRLESADPILQRTCTRSRRRPPSPRLGPVDDRSLLYRSDRLS